MSTPKVHKPQGQDGGDKLIIESGGEVDVRTGGKIAANGTQAAAIADISESAGEMSAAERVKFNAVLAALRGAGIIAAS